MIKHDVVRVIGETKRIFGGTERRDRIKLNGITLKGYVRVRRQNGTQTEETCFLNRHQKILLTVPGFDWVWLATRNSRTVKLAA